MRAEYDRTHNRVVTIETEDGRHVPTHNPRVLGADTEWLPVEIRYPEGYDDRFSRLLFADTMRYEYDSGADKVLVVYPDADFSPEALRREVRNGIKNAARERLSRTDWVVVRYVETGEAIPAEVSRERARIRAEADRFEAELDEVPDEEISSFSFSFLYPTATEESRRSEPVVKGGDGREWVTDATSPDDEGAPVRPAEDDERASRSSASAAAPRGRKSGPVAPPAQSGLPWVDGDER